MKNFKERRKMKQGKRRMLSRFLIAMLGIQLIFVLNVYGQQTVTVSGTVTDAQGQPLPGVTVVQEETTNGTVTNNDGVYTINVPGDATLVFSFVGMSTQRVPVNSRRQINIRMEVGTIGLEEVIAVGYGTMKKRDLTGSVVSIGQEEINENPKVNLSESLQGALPGLNVGQINSVGSSPNISIRGITSLAGEQSPLIIVDGVIWRGNLVDINPNDIQSIDVLKDASSTAIYGSQASNGVVLITTIKGRSKLTKPVLKFSTYYDFQSPKELKRESVENFKERLYDIEIYESRTEESGYLEKNPNYDVTGLFKTNDQVWAYENDKITDWRDYIVNENMYTFNSNLSISDRNENSGYFISVGFTQQAGFLKNDDYDRLNARLNIDSKITDWMEIGVQSAVTNSDYSGQALSVGTYWRHTYYTPPFDEEGNYTQSPDGLNINPLLRMGASDYDKRINLFGNVYTKIDIPYVKGLSFKTNFSTNSRVYSKYYFREYEQNFTGEGSKRDEFLTDWSNDNILNYSSIIANKHSIDLTFVYGFEKRNSKWTQAAASSFPSFALGYNKLQAGSSDLQTAESGAWEETSLYNMVRVFYGFDQKYLFSGTIRRDGFSGFSEDNKFGIFPSAAVAFVVSELSFLQETDWLDYLKLRVSYGSNGNRTIGRYDTQPRVTGGYDYIDANKNSVYAQTITRMASPNLKWETTTGINIGVDFTIFSNRLFGSIEYYNSNTKDLLYNVDLPSIGRYSKFPDNLGKINNYGNEFSLSSVNLKNSDFEWTSTFSFSRNRNILKELLGFDVDGDGVEDDLVSESLFIGKDLNTFFDYETNGDIWQLGDDVPTTANVGSYVIQDLNSDGNISPDDRTTIGSSEPSFRFSIQNKFQYKNWTLSFFINSIQGSDRYYLGRDNIYSMELNESAAFALHAKDIDYWVPENPNAKYPALVSRIPFRATLFTPRSFIRLRDVNLSYNFNNDFLTKFKIDNLRIFFNGTNLVTWTKWPGWDPETGQGITPNGNPIMKSHILGLDLTF